MKKKKKKIMNLTDNFEKLFEQEKGTMVESVTKDYIELHLQSSFARNICFVQPDGSMRSENYAYLISCKYIPATEQIEMEFSGVAINLRGRNLRLLFELLLWHGPKRIIAIQARYEATIPIDNIVVTEIEIKDSSGSI